MRPQDNDGERRNEPTDAELKTVEQAAQAIPDARDLYKDATPADMYDPKNKTFFPELRASHRKLDAAIEAAHGVDFNSDEEEIVSHLLKLYAEKINQKMESPATSLKLDDATGDSYEFLLLLGSQLLCSSKPFIQLVPVRV